MSFIPFTVPQQLREPFERYLTVPDILPDSSADVLYILGGSPKSTRRHIVAAIGLHEKQRTERILIFSVPGKLRYDLEQQRNLTQNEWSQKQLSSVGVPAGHIDFMSVRGGLFGTLSEARALPVYLREHGYGSVILLSSPGHMRRVALSFGHYLRTDGISMYNAHSDDPFSFRELVLETIKLNVYCVLLFFETMFSPKPNDALHKHSSNGPHAG